jgi:DNA recombination protein RmuC
MDGLMQTAGGWIQLNGVILLLGANVFLAGALIVLLTVMARRMPSGGFNDLKERIAAMQQRQPQIEQSVKDEIARNRQEAADGDRRTREEIGTALQRSADALLHRVTEHAAMQKDMLDAFARQVTDMTRLNADRFEAQRRSMEQQLQAMREENGRKLEQMRQTVDEKLQATLERRLGASFRQVSDRLEQVYKGLGEMRHLAGGVGDLKKMLANVKTRGTWGEIRLGSILEQILSPEQYDTNVATRRNSSERVEFAIRLPGSPDETDSVVWLPIDSKFPQEDYQRLLDAGEAGDREQAEKSLRALEVRIKAEARFVREKYIDPPRTTDFGIIFLPVEGLYAEVLRRPGLCDQLQRDHRVVVAGPATLAALLNSLQMGFRTLAIQKRSGEVWRLLGLVKTEFGKFGDVLAQTRKKLSEASRTIDQAEVRTRAIQRRLRNVEELPLDPVPQRVADAEKP